MPSITEWIRSWRLLSWRSAIVAAIVLYALVGFFVAPWVVRNQIEKQSLALLKRQATVERVRCNPFTLSLTIDGFSLPDRPGSVLLAWDRLYANAELSSIFRWAATLKELRVERPYLALRRFPDGSINVVELVKEIQEGKPPPKEEKDARLPRALLQQVQVIDGRIDVEDRLRPEPLLWEVGPSQIELLDISTIPEREGSNDLVMRLPGGGAVKISGKVKVEPLSLDGTFVLEDNALASSWRAVRHMFKFDLTRGVMGLDLDYHVGFGEDGLAVIVDNANGHITDFGLRWEEQEVELLTADSITLTGGHLELPEQVVSADALIIDGATAFQWIEADGTPSWNVLVPKESQEELVRTYQTIEKHVKAKAHLGRFELRNSGAEFEDRTLSPPARFRISDAALVVSDISSEVGTTWPFEGSLAIEGEAAASAEGAFGAAPLALDVAVSLENLGLAKYQPYLAKFAPLDLRAGVLGVDGAVRGSKERGQPLSASFEGGFQISGLDLNETVTGDKLLGWGDLKVAGIDAELQPMSLKVRDVDVDHAGLEITVAEDGSINLLELFHALSRGKDESSGKARSDGSGLPPVRIAQVQLKECYGIYTDKSVRSEPFRLALIPIDGTVSGIANDSRSAAKIDIDAGIESGGLVRVDGRLDPFDYRRLTELSIDVRNLKLPAMSPMGVKFIGYPIVNGDLALDLDYDIEDSYLKAENRIDADDLELGDKVEGEGLINLPFKLGVSLLKDKEGRIVLEIPFEGSFATPGFGMASAATAAVKEIMTELLKAPFRVLGKAGGGGSDRDLEFVEFEAGSAVLSGRTAEDLDTLASGLVDRPTLKLGINGCYDEEADARGLRELALREELAARGVVLPGESTDLPLDALESMYRERQSPAALDALRVQYTASPGGGAQPALDEQGYREAILGTLLAAQAIDAGAVAALAPARAEAIRARLAGRPGLDGGRLSVEPDATPVKDSGGWVRCQLELSAD